ncbi:MAG: hypothetical protein SV186_00475 [Candidatus Nanohaloarchaea archaeon]|nr:hypothetical protein [Candidatus Nanohaloarchaea archaeon]
MVEFETIEKDRKDYGDFGGENFIEVSRNKAIQEDGSENTFLQIATGYYSEDGDRYKKRFTVPVDEDAVQHVLDALPEMLEKEQEARKAAEADEDA